MAAAMPCITAAAKRQHFGPDGLSLSGGAICFVDIGLFRGRDFEQYLARVRVGVLKQAGDMTRPPGPVNELLFIAIIGARRRGGWHL
jgi:hypothetical protein